MKKPSIQKLSRVVLAFVVAGVAALPVAASAATDTSSVEATVNSVISVASATTVPITVTPTSGAGTEATASDAVTVDSNDGDGYDLTLSNSDTTLTMAGFKDDGTTSNGATLAAASGTYGTPAALGSNTWGWRVDGLGSFGAGGTTTYAGVPSSASPQNIKTTTATANAEATTVKYAVKVNLSVPNGVYKDTVTYTATAK